MEEIDDLRNSYIDLRKDLKESREKVNAQHSRLQVEFLRTQDKLKTKGDKNPYRITEDCITCGSCKPECKFDAIIEGDPYVILLENCTACQACAKVCPVDACVPIQ
ncbi:4Fe-4S binding protein [bacterium]|nr:4Fe-4S binding protein [candidate division CSSED10-310 bacterium]